MILFTNNNHLLIQSYFLLISIMCNDENNSRFHVMWQYAPEFNTQDVPIEATTSKPEKRRHKKLRVAANFVLCKISYQEEKR